MIKIIIHITLAFSIFLSSGGFWINNHYCQDKFIKSSFLFCFGSCCKKDKLEDCNEEKRSCSHKEQKEKKNCCHNEPDFYKLDQDQQLLKVEFKPFKSLLTWHAIIPHTQLRVALPNNRSLRYLNYIPPPIVFDRQVRLQTFLC